MMWYGESYLCVVALVEKSIYVRIAAITMLIRYYLITSRIKCIPNPGWVLMRLFGNQTNNNINKWSTFHLHISKTHGVPIGWGVQKRGDRTKSTNRFNQRSPTKASTINSIYITLKSYSINSWTLKRHQFETDNSSQSTPFFSPFGSK